MNAWVRRGISFLVSSIVLLILSLVSSNTLSTEWCCSDNDGVAVVVVVSTLAVSSETFVVLLSDSFFQEEPKKPETVRSKQRAIGAEYDVSHTCCVKKNGYSLKANSWELIISSGRIMILKVIDL